MKNRRSRCFKKNMNIIPLTNDPAQRFGISLNAQKLFFEIKWNYGASFWTLGLSDTENTLITGVTMMTGKNLFIHHKDLIESIGQLWVWDKSGLGISPTLDNLGSEVILLHFIPGETVPVPDIDTTIDIDLLHEKNGHPSKIMRNRGL